MLTHSGTKILRELKRFNGAVRSSIVRSIRANGYCVWPDFLPGDICVRMVGLLEEVFSTWPEKVQHERVEGTSGDYRLFGLESEVPLVKRLVADDARLQAVAHGYLGENVVAHFVLANKVVHTPGLTCNSGAGWHRDSGRRQFKAIVYLTDVNHENGPFTIIPGSRQLRVSVRDGARNSHRFDDETVQELVSRHNRQVVEVVGRAGTCILADTSNIHRGKDIEAGVRYALTNYYFEDTRRRRSKTQAKWGAYLLKPVV